MADMAGFPELSFLVDIEALGTAKPPAFDKRVPAIDQPDWNSLFHSGARLVGNLDGSGFWL
jgi:hypothetical protein